MLLKYFKFLFLGLFLLVSGCFQIFPNECKLSLSKLPEATVNQPYFQEIEITGGAMIDESNIKWEIIPQNSGLNIERFINHDGTGYGGAEISGVPKKQGNVSIHLYGYGYSYCNFNKTLEIKVNPE